MPLRCPFTHLSAAAFLLLGMAFVRDSRADWVSDWNDYALTAAKNTDQLSPDVSRTLSMLNTAIYNAVQGIAGDYNLYAHGAYTGPSGSAATGANIDAAVSTAAYTILSELYPQYESTFSAYNTAQLSTLTNNQALFDGVNFGTIVATDILNWRANDKDNPGIYNPVGSVGYWSPTSSNPAALHYWGNLNTFAITDTATYNGSLGMSNPAYVQTAGYAADYNQLKTVGSSTSTTTGDRTQAQEDAAFFWQGAPGTTTNVGLWNEVAKGIVTSQSLTLDQSARLYAALNVALADAAIVAWDTKFETDFWSPVTAINNGAFDNNALTTGDPAWTSLLTPPDVPSYFAEQAILAAAAAGILDDFAGSTYAFSLSSDTDGDGNADFTFNFSSLADAMNQASNSVVWGGINFQKSATDGAAAGSQIADAVMSTQFAAVPEPAGALLLVLSAMVCLGRRRRA